MITLTVFGKPITKKNNQQILYNQRTKRPFISPSKQYKQYRTMFLRQVKPMRINLDIQEPICIQALYYMPDRRKVDITNLMNATHDLLTEAGIIADDSSKIVKSVDGTRVLVDKDNPRVEITITKFKEA